MHQSPQRPAEHLLRAEGVEDDVHLNAGAGTTDQRVDERVGNAPGVHDKGFKIDRPLGRADRVDHRSVELGAVGHDLDVVAAVDLRWRGGLQELQQFVAFRIERRAEMEALPGREQCGESDPPQKSSSYGGETLDQGRRAVSVLIHTQPALEHLTCQGVERALPAFDTFAEPFWHTWHAWNPAAACQRPVTVE